MQGIVFRRGDVRFDGRSPEEAIRVALADPACLMVNRNQGAGTRIVIDNLLSGARPDGYWNQPRSHNAVAAAVAQGRADWGVAIEAVARARDLGFIPLGHEHYDFALVTERRNRPAVRAFLDALTDPEVQEALGRLGFAPAQPTRSHDLEAP
jgi:putative molybdopterin biosynthesis protein